MSGNNAVWMPVGMGAGIAIGAAVGVATDNMALWLALGVAIGSGLGVGLRALSGAKRVDKKAEEAAPLTDDVAGVNNRADTSDAGGSEGGGD